MMVNIICKNLNSPMVIRSPKPANDPFLFGNGEVSRPVDEKAARWNAWAKRTEAKAWNIDPKADPIFLCDDNSKVKA